MTPPPPRYLDLLARLDAARGLGVSLGLERVRAALAALGHPERRAVTVQIAGTNGKGSTAAMTDAILRAAGIRTGLYTSPHLARFTERIRVDGREVGGDRLAALDRAIVATGVPLTYFEIATVLGFLAFADAGAEVVVLETGLGGRLDATTAAEPIATAITGIALDHTEILGPRLADIAREKAGIAKAGVPLYLAPVPREADAVIAEVAAAVGAPVRRFGRDFQPAPVVPALPGAHQVTNAALAVALARAAVAALGRQFRDGPTGPVETGLGGVAWPGRLERVGTGVLLDCAHNVDGAAALGAALDADGGPVRPRALVLSVVEGKPAREMLALLAPRFGRIVATRSTNPRALGAAALAALAPADAAARVVAVEDPHAAVARARADVGPDGLVVIAGSTFLIGDVRTALLGDGGGRDPVPTSDPLHASREVDDPDTQSGTMK